MNAKNVTKRITDILMSLTLLFLMGFQFWGNAAHEIAGAFMLVLVILHNVLNASFYKSLFRGKYSASRIIFTLVNVLLLVSIILTAVSGIMMSVHVFSFLNIDFGMGFARLTHLCCSYWSFVLVSLHLGLHWNMISSAMMKKIKGKTAKVVLCSIGFAMAFFGCVSFFIRGIPNYLFLKTQFAFMDSQESKLLFYFQYICITAFFVLLAKIATAIATKKVSK